MAGVRGKNWSATADGVDGDGPTLPAKLAPDGLLIGYSLEEEAHRPVMGFRFGEAVEDEDAADDMLEPVLHTGDGHLITLARTGAGKGVGCIIPALLRYRGPVIVIDPKGENYQVTARRRRELGQKVLLLDPFGVTGEETGALNPLDLINPRSPEAIDSAAQLAELIVTKQHTQDPFWDSRAYSLITTMLLFVASGRPPVLRNLQEMHYLLNQTNEDMDFTFKEILKSSLPSVRQGGSIKSTAEGKVWASILSTAQSHTDFLRSAGAQATLGRSTIDLKAITRGDPISIYVVVPPEKLESHGKLLRLWIGVLMAAITQRSRRPELPTLFILDEAAQLGPLKQLRQAITLLRGYGLRTWSFWQDLSQLQMLYPNDWKTMINNCEVLQVFGLAGWIRPVIPGAELAIAILMYGALIAALVYNVIERFVPKLIVRFRDSVLRAFTYSRFGENPLSHPERLAKDDAEIRPNAWPQDFNERLLIKAFNADVEQWLQKLPKNNRVLLALDLQELPPSSLSLRTLTLTTSLASSWRRRHSIAHGNLPLPLSEFRLRTFVRSTTDRRHTA